LADILQSKTNYAKNMSIQYGISQFLSTTEISSALPFGSDRVTHVLIKTCFRITEVREITRPGT
jgi:hypothetical protein